MKEFGKHYRPDSIYYLLDHMGFSWITSRSKHPKQSQLTQEDLKKVKIETILKIPGHITLECIDVLFQDEVRFGQQNSTTHLWTEKATRPRAEKQQFEYAYLFGSVFPRKGIGEAIVVPWVHKDIMIEHLAVTEEGCHAVVVMDGAGWHTEEIANDFKMSVSSNFRPILQS
ncbi:winged helix-turn-helix domain-containing protein [Vibrio parahaemolyticus]|nr:winged helix-turn-helix domain-containing protein [Vibrio parahaemolyticus]MDF4656145.1 winged helix-turn-helix domain-containing protein [Vibrio parahaemolyticus]